MCPYKAGGALRDQLYTFEVGIPWRWLGFYPQPDMVLDALFLLPDSDLPNEELRDKVRQSNKWIWWQGKVQLKGQPPGLRQLPKQEVIAEIAEKTREITVPKVDRDGQDGKRDQDGQDGRLDRDGQDEKRQDGQDLGGGEGNLGGQERITAKGDSGDSGTCPGRGTVTRGRAYAAVAAESVVVGQEEASAGLGAGAQ